MLSIVIPVHNAFDYTKECIDSIRDCTSDYEIILIDNGSELDMQRQFPGGDIVHIRNRENLGFPKAVNQGLKEAKGEYICILNNDIVVTPKWSDHLIWHLNKNLDIVGPRTNIIDGPQILLIDRYDNKEELYQRAEEHCKTNKHKQWAFPRLVGFCLMFKREVYDKIGGLNEDYGIGNFEDDDWCLLAIDEGFKLGIARDVYLHHFGSITHKLLDLDYVKLISKNQKIFEAEWSKEEQKRLSELNEERINGKRKKNK